MHKLQRSWVRSQHPPAQWNLRGGRWSSAEYCTNKKRKKNPPKNIYKKKDVNPPSFACNSWQGLRTGGRGGGEAEKTQLAATKRCYLFSFHCAGWVARIQELVLLPRRLWPKSANLSSRDGERTFLCTIVNPQFIFYKKKSEALVESMSISGLIQRAHWVTCSLEFCL